MKVKIHEVLTRKNRYKRLVFILVENFFGGEGRFRTKIEGREFTPTERRIIQKEEAIDKKVDTLERKESFDTW